jgi:hypothetical protein
VAAPILVANAGVEDINRALLDLSSKLPSASGASVSSIKSVTSDYTFTPSDGLIDLFVTTGSSTINVTLGRSAANKGRVVRVWKADSGTGEVAIVGNTTGSTTETINGYSSIRAGLQYQHCDIYQDGVTNYLVGQYLQPVASEPSAGSLHLYPENNITTRIAINGAAVAAGWSAAIDCSSFVPVGAKAILAEVTLDASAAGIGLMDGQVAYSDNTANTPALGTSHFSDASTFTITAGNSLVRSRICHPILLTSSRTFYYYRLAYTNCTSLTLYVVVKGYYC